MRARLLLTLVHDVGPLFESEVGPLFDRTMAAMPRRRTPKSVAELRGGLTPDARHISANPLPITQN